MKILVLYILTLTALFAQPVQTDHVEAELVPEFTGVTPGVTFTVALKLKMDEHWHTYWRNPGDSGIPTKIKWDLPDGFSAGEIKWQYPKKIIISGLANIVYEDEVLLLTDITPPDSISKKFIEIKAKADWLVCKVECLPGSTSLTLQLPVTSSPEPHPVWAERINETRSKLPVKNVSWDFSSRLEQDTVYLEFSSLSQTTDKHTYVNFFPYEGGIFDNIAPQKLSLTDDLYTLSLPLEAFRTHEPDTISGILVSDVGWRGEGSEKAIEINVVPGAVSLNGEMGNSEESLLLILALAFAGGLILNLMPCVLPVLSLKIMGFVQQASSSKKEIYKHGISFTVGVLFSFWMLAGVLLLLQSGGEKLGWGFQLQEPLFLLVLIVLMFLFALNLFGVFEIGTSLTQLGGAGAKTGGLAGSFISGITATIVATPCTAPFMGTALGYTLTQSAGVTMLVFTFLALGMAFPYLILSFFPSWLKIIPKPGNWMIVFKQFMGFLLAATVIWLLWVLANIKGSDAVILTLLILLFASVSGWIYGKWGDFTIKKSVRYTAIVVSLFVLMIPAYYFGSEINNTDQQNEINISGKWESFNTSKVNDFVENGKPVFIDFTATWCLTCQVNKKVALHDESVTRAFNEKGVTTLIADWTKRDDEITDALASFGRNSVPLYVLYSGKKGEKPIILPEVLTPDIVKEYINQL